MRVLLTRSSFPRWIQAVLVVGCCTAISCNSQKTESQKTTRPKTIGTKTLKTKTAGGTKTVKSKMDSRKTHGAKTSTGPNLTGPKTTGPKKTGSKTTAKKVDQKNGVKERSDNVLKMVFCWCPKGKFKMGSPKGESGRTKWEDQVDVTLSSGFWLGKYEVTQSQYQAVMGKNPSKSKGDSLPVEQVTWTEATEFCKKLTKSEGTAGRLPKGLVYRLATEAQWEYACRAGTTSVYSFGNKATQLGKYAWHGDNSGFKPHAVGQKKPNTWGLYDMHGNVREWCRDSFDTLLGGTDPVTMEEDARIVHRGGGFNEFANSHRSANRGRDRISYRDFYVGFRVALVQAGK